MTTPAPFLSRHLGDYLLVAQLSEDALGTVFRALYAADERRFVRLRILQSEELSRDAIDRAIRESVLCGALVHDAIVPRAQLESVEGIPFLTWDEAAGWTLDTMLARVRAFGIRIPAEYALLITERIAAALEHAHQTVIEGRPADHGLLWPGFVSISHDAAVRVGGFGVADAVLPALQSARLLSEIGPYVAPEVRRGGPVGKNSDVYSLGAILIELLTGRRPSLDTPSAELRAGDPRSEELESFLEHCLAPPEERFSSAVDAHRALQQMVTGNPFSLYTANLALFLYKLLNPESQSVAPSSDWESTNPVVVHGPTPPPPEGDAPAPLPRRRCGDLQCEEVFQSPPGPEHAPAPEAPPPAAHMSAPIAPEEHGEPYDPLRQSRLPRSPSARAWIRPAAAAAGIAVGVFFVASQIQSLRNAATPGRVAVETTQAVSSEQAEAAAAPAVPAVVASASQGAPAAAVSGAKRAAPARAARRVRTGLRQPAEDLRLRAALARIEADRWNARETAGEVFGEGRSSEEEGERLLRQRDYDAAQLAFSRAARLFQQAQELTWEERIRQADLAQAK
jgi:serine/threonine protein kinase